MPVRRHDYSNPLIQSNAVLYGIAECLEQDTGLKRGDKDAMQALWDALDAAEYRDSKLGRTVDYIDAKSGNYTGLDWGFPGNLEDMPDAYNFQNYGTYEFPYYCNGCMDVVNGSEPAYSILKWDGTPTDYEGIISRDCSFLQTALLNDDPARELFQHAAAQKQ